MNFSNVFGREMHDNETRRMVGEALRTKFKHTEDSKSVTDGDG